MARKKTHDQVLAELEKTRQDIKLQREKEKKLEALESDMTRKERTHRLCTHGAMLEQYINPDEFTDEQIESILKSVFRRSDTIELLERERNSS